MDIATGQAFLSSGFTVVIKQNNRMIILDLNENLPECIPYPSHKFKKDELQALKEMVDDALKELE